MILKKMTEYNEQGIKDESFILIIEDRDEGWELSRKEMLKLQKLVEQSLKEFAEKRETEKINAPELYTGRTEEFKRSTTANWKLCREEEKTLEFIADVEAAVDKYGEDVVFQQPEDQADECPEYIEPPASEATNKTGFYEIVGIEEETTPEVICEDGACALVLEEVEIVPEKAENPPEIAEKVQKQDKKNQPEKDYASYVLMVKENKAPRFIRKAMVEDLGLTEGTAENYFYTRVKPEAMRQIKEEKDRAIEKEKKRLENHLEKKIQVIPASPYHGSSERVHFTEDEKERIRIRRQAGSKI